ncbi:MAG: acetylglutamate kinase [Bacteroidales bacterium]|nr:acetylglutamate kinase [Bacteroidales bacterium]
MLASAAFAESLLRACAQARSLRDRVLVVKLGGSAMEDPTATQGTLESITALQTLGVRLVLVHGGGKPIDRGMAEAGITPRKVAGRRYTDEATLAVVVRVLLELNQGIIERLTTLGGRAVTVTDSLFGDRLHLMDDHSQPIDLGRVGQPNRVDVGSLGNLLNSGTIPVIPCLARSTVDGGWLNVNADTAAAAIAGALSAEACLFLTDTPGVLQNVREPESLIPSLTESQCQQLITSGVIAGGMIPKVEACLAALAAGASRAVILDGRNPYALLSGFITDRLIGTEFRK